MTILYIFTSQSKFEIMKDKITAALLAFFLGGIGIHRFYLGENWLGFFYLIFCWTFIPLFFAFIDFICFLVMSQQTFDSKYNQNTIIYRGFNYPSDNYENKSSNIAEEIERLHSLKEKGIISYEDFEKAKSKLLG